jgi:formate/nitrite transporter FocA (FNT family)
MTAGVIEGKATMGDLIKNWIVSYAGNFIGSVFLAYLVFSSGVMAAPSVAICICICIHTYIDT